MTPFLKAKEEIVPKNHCNLFIGARWEKVIEKGENRKSKGLRIGGKNGTCPVFLNVDTLKKCLEKDLNQSRQRADSVISNVSENSTSATKPDLVAHCIFFYPQADIFFDLDEKENDENNENNENNAPATNVKNQMEATTIQKATKDEFQYFTKDLAEKVKSGISSILEKHTPQRGMVFYYDRKSLGKYRALFMHVLDQMEDVYEWNFEPSALESRKIDDNDAEEKKKAKNRNDIMNKSAELLQKLSEKWYKKQDSVSTVQDGEFEFYDQK